MQKVVTERVPVGQHPAQPRSSLYFISLTSGLWAALGKTLSLPRPGAMILATFVKCLGKKKPTEKGNARKKNGRCLYEPIPLELKRAHAEWEGRQERHSSRDGMDRTRV